MNLERELREALKPVAAPGDLEARVLAALDRSHTMADVRPAARPREIASIEAGARPRRSADARHGGLWLGRALAASLLLAVGGGTWWLEMDRRREAERAHTDVLRALAITSERLDDITARVVHAGHHNGD